MTLFEDAGFDDPDALLVAQQLTQHLCRGSVASTPETRERYAFLRKKRLGETWQEGRLLYRKGANGVTVWNTVNWGWAYPLVRDHHL